jgi:hypothetical protein
MAPRVAGLVTWWPHATVRIGLAVPGRPIRSLAAEDRSAGGVRDRTGPEPSVLAGSVAHRDHRGTDGHQRSPAAKRNRRSAGLQVTQLAQRQRPDQIVVPKITERRRWRSRFDGRRPSTVDVAVPPPTERLRP